MLLICIPSLERRVARQRKMSLMLTVLSMLPRPVREYIMPDMLIPPISNNPSKVQLVRLSHVYFEHHDLSKFAKFVLEYEVTGASSGRDRLWERRF